MSFTTKPEAPTDFEAALDDYMPFYRIQLTWDAGTGADYTYIVMNTGHYPADRSDGLVLYDGTGTSFVHSGLDPETTYYYRAWSHVEDSYGQDVWSDSYDGDYAETDPEPASADMEITLQPGWNMVSVPLLMSNSTVAAVFPGAEAVYTWNPSNKSYASPPVVDPKLAYWVAVPSVTVLELHGVPFTAWEQPILTGWNMVGSIYYVDSVPLASVSTSPQPDTLERTAIYTWDPVAKSYIARTIIESGKGYWMATTANRTLSMSPPP